MTSCSKLLSAILCSTDRSVQIKQLLVMSVSRLRTRSYEIFVSCVRPISSYYIQTTNKTRMLNIDVKGGKYERGCGSSPVVLLHAYLNIAVCLPCIAMHAQFPAQKASVSAEASEPQPQPKFSKDVFAILVVNHNQQNGKRKVLSIGESNPGLPRLTRGNSHDKRKS